MASNHHLIPESIQKNQNEINEGICFWRKYQMKKIKYMFLQKVSVEQGEDLDDIVVINPSEHRESKILDI